MREKLAYLRGKLVAWRGWETGSRHNRTWICVSKASITQWDGITPIILMQLQGQLGLL